MGEGKLVERLADEAIRTRPAATNIGMIPPFYAETGSVKGDEDWPRWIVRNKTCNSLGYGMPREIAEPLAAAMNARAALTQEQTDG